MSFSRLRVLIGLALASSALPATASTAEMGNITGLYAMSNGAVLFSSSGARTAKPACQGPGLEARWALDGSTVADQAQIALLLNAYNLKKKIFIHGHHTCSIWGDKETVMYFAMQD